MANPPLPLLVIQPTPIMQASDYLAHRKERIDQALTELLPSCTQDPKRLHDAMRYAVLNGGKRLRPLLVYATGETFGASLTTLDRAACAVELIHAYSLVHDDLPAMDNDDLRRGIPTCHKAFDETTAILVGDALQALAFEIIASSQETHLSPTQQLNMLTILAKASGSFGMVGGQALEFSWADQKINLEQQETIHLLKTGALITASIQLGAIAANVSSNELNILTQFGNTLGLAFQIQDDIQDYKIEQSSRSYLSHMDLPQASEKLIELYEQTQKLFNQLGDIAMPLRFVTDCALSDR